MANEKKEEEKKIIVDEDWKAEAQREKEILAAQEDAEKKTDQKEQQTRGPLPPGNFAALVSTLATQAIYSMGLLGIEGKDKPPVDLELARYNIDMLATIEEKTRGNLDEGEEKILKNTLNDLRMGYVKMIEQAEKSE